MDVPCNRSSRGDGASQRDRGAELVADLARRLTDDAVVVLGRAGIMAAPLKGVLLLARWPELRGLRNLVDVDLLVSPDDFVTAEQSLRALGFTPTSTTHHGATLENKDWPLSLDLHHRLFGPRLFDLPTPALLARAERDETLFEAPILRLNDMDLFAHVIGHAVKSRFSASYEPVGHDVRWLLANLSVDPRAYASHLRKCRMHRAAGYVLGAKATRDQPRARAVAAGLELDASDRAAIAIAAAWPSAYWAPHLLNGRLTNGVRSLGGQLREDLGWRARRWLSRAERA